MSLEFSLDLLLPLDLFAHLLFALLLSLLQHNNKRHSTCSRHLDVRRLTSSFILLTRNVTCCMSVPQVSSCSFGKRFPPSLRKWRLSWKSLQKIDNFLSRTTRNVTGCRNPSSSTNGSTGRLTSFQNDFNLDFFHLSCSHAVDFVQRDAYRMFAWWKDAPMLASLDRCCRKLYATSTWSHVADTDRQLGDVFHQIQSCHILSSCITDILVHSILFHFAQLQYNFLSCATRSATGSEHTSSCPSKMKPWNILIQVEQAVCNLCRMATWQHSCREHSKWIEWSFPIHALHGSIELPMLRAWDIDSDHSRHHRPSATEEYSEW